MALTPSNMLPLGTVAPAFELPDTLNEMQPASLASLKGGATLIAFICNHCPYVKHINEQLVSLGNDYKEKDFSMIAISSNDVVNYPEDSPAKMTEYGKELGYPFPYLYDETQEVAKAYDAACTPDFYLFDSELKLVYRGQLDGSRPGNGLPVTGVDLRKAIDEVLAGNEIPTSQTPSVGCNIKWK